MWAGQPSGSIGSIAVSESNPNVVYVGSGEGLQRPDLSTGDGVYKSTDAGKTWTHLKDLRDGQQIGQVAVDPKDPNKVFVAVTGHPYGPNEQRGLYLSRDGGATFKRVLYTNDRTGASDVQIDPQQSADRLCRDVAAAGGSVGERLVHRRGRRYVQVDGRRRYLDEDDRPRTSGRHSAGADRDCADRPEEASTPRSRRCVAASS